ncbi:MAG: hypothetical protein QNJ54_15365 [Prochloraceae cyanobacterium]|nr:hypothetical protein [Prochloraceae cyanobacterium]
MEKYILQVSGHGGDQGGNKFPVADKWQYKFFSQVNIQTVSV